MSNSSQASQPAEHTAVTVATVVAGLGYPSDRKETSPEPTGWLNVSRETSEVSASGESK